MKYEYESKLKTFNTSGHQITEVTTEPRPPLS